MLTQLNLAFYVIALAAALGFGFLGQWDISIASFACAVALSAHLRIASER